MPNVQIHDDAKARETREYPNQPRQSADQGQTDRHAQATPDVCQHFENHPAPTNQRYGKLRPERGACALQRVDAEDTLAKLPHVGGDSRYELPNP